MTSSDHMTFIRSKVQNSLMQMVKEELAATSKYLQERADFVSKRNTMNIVREQFKRNKLEVSVDEESSAMQESSMTESD